jgi:polyisoprenoid-binding protein YceI
MKLIKLTLLSLFGSAILLAGNYDADIAHSNIGFKVKHMMVSNVRGNFTDFSGTFELDETDKTLKKLEGTVQAKSINTGIEKRDKHLRSDDFLDVAQFPLIRFIATKFEKDKVHGNLTMHGITKAVVLDYEFGGVVTDPMGKQRAGLTLEGKINRADYGMTWNKLIEAGGIAVSETVKLEIELEGILKK